MTDFFRISVCIMPGNFLLSALVPDLTLGQLLLIGLTLFIGGYLYAQWASNEKKDGKENRSG